MAQVLALRDAGCDKIFSEVASGARADRPQLTAALNYMRQDDTLVIWKLDRPARSLRQLLETVDKLEQHSVGLVSITEQLDTGSPGGRLVFHLFGALAEFERGLIRERTMSGLARAKSLGRVGGRPRKLSDEDIVAAKAFLTPFSAREVAARLEVAPSTLYARLRAPG